MKKTGLVLALALVFVVAGVCATGSTDAYASDGSGFPSVSEIFSTVEWPDYSFSTFMDDFKTMFSAEMWSQIALYFNELKDFIILDTFLGDLANVSGESFTGENAYVNIFVLICVVIAIICVFGALFAYLANRKTFNRARDKEQTQ